MFSQVTVEFHNVSECSECLSGYHLNHFFFFLIFFTELHMVMERHELLCHVDRFVCHLLGQDHSKGLYDQSMILSSICSEVLILWQPNLV